MDIEKRERLQACLQEVAQILYEESDPATIQDLAGIEQTIRGHLLAYIGPELGVFLSAKSRVLSGVGCAPSRASLGI